MILAGEPVNKRKTNFIHNVFAVFSAKFFGSKKHISFFAISCLKQPTPHGKKTKNSKNGLLWLTISAQVVQKSHPYAMQKFGFHLGLFSAAKTCF